MDVFFFISILEMISVTLTLYWKSVCFQQLQSSDLSGGDRVIL